MKTAKILLDIGAVQIRSAQPFRLTAGNFSPVYVDCRKIISFVPERRAIIRAFADLVQRADLAIDIVAGGETAGIPFAAWLAEELHKPMAYIRKQPKGFGRNAQIEGEFKPGERFLLVEDLASSGGSKRVFVEAIRNAGGAVKDIFVVFFYSAFPGGADLLRDLDVELHALATWHDILALAEAERRFDAATLRMVRDYLADPIGWSNRHAPPPDAKS